MKLARSSSQGITSAGISLALAAFLAASWADTALAQRPLGIDVSYWQAQNGLPQTTWDAVAAAGRTFAMVRITHYSIPGTESDAHGDPDPACGNNVDRARAAGLLVGIYHFARPSIRTPQTEATAFINYATTYFGKNYLSSGYLRPMLDLEDGSSTSHVGATSLTDWCTQWMNAVETQTGVEPMIYCGGNYAKLLDSSMATRTLWFANYNCSANPQTANPTASISPWSHWTFWQYCSSLSVGGISPVDTDVFNGTAAELQTFVIGGGNLPPAISGVQATGITNNAATITWTTNSASSSQVEYGLTASYGSSSPLDNNAVTSHSVGLSGLTPNTLYHYRVISTNAYGTTNSSDYTFTTTGPPSISGVSTSGIGADAVTILWTTNAPSTSQVKYGLTSSYGSQTTLNSNLVTSHSVVLTGLTPNTLYHYQVLSTNSYGAAQSNDFTFTTAGAAVISGVASSNVTSTTATITWTTDVPSNTQVEYGTTIAYSSSSTLDPASAISHSVTLSGLSPSTLYHYRARSANAGGTTYSGDYTFTTTAIATEILIDNVDSGCTKTGTWTTGSVAPQKIGTNYLYASASGSSSSTTATCRWTPNIPAAGSYDVYVYYQIGSNRNSSVPYSIYNGTTIPVPSQSQYSTQDNQGGWFKLNSTPVSFAVGTGGYVQVANNTSTSGLISADAAKFVRVDGQAPTVPADLTATAASNTSIQLNWTASTDDTGVSGYKIYRNSVYLTTSATNSFLDSSLAANTSYSYRISAYDAGNNESGQSAAVSRATLSVAPGSGSVTPDNAAACTGATVTWTAVGGFGAGKAQYYRYVWDQSPTHSFQGGEPQWSSGTITTTVSATGAWYLHVRGFNADNLANGTFDYLVSNSCRRILAWRSVQTHGATQLGIGLDATNGATPVLESRSGGIQRIEIDFDGGITLGNAASIQVTGVTTTDGVAGTPVTYTPTAASLADADTLAITFAPGVLPDATCYTITLNAGAIAESLLDDIDCSIRALVGDVTGNGAVNLGDVILTARQAGQALADRAGFDFDMNGAIDAADVQAIKALVTSPGRSVVCP